MAHDKAYLICENKCLVEGMVQGEAYTKEEVNALLAAKIGYSVGDYLLRPINSVADDRFMYCDGRAISRTTYADLYSLIGTTFGTGDGSTTFNIPKWNDGRFLAGTGLNRLAPGQLQEDKIRNIKGRFYDYGLEDNQQNKGSCGSFSNSTSTTRQHCGHNSAGISSPISGAIFDANANNSSSWVSDSNPMAGHANGAEIHPKNMTLAVFIRVK